MCALLTNSRVPVIAHMTNAPQVKGSTSCSISVIRLDLDARPSRRRSMIATVPNTRTREITCTVSMVGKAQDEEAI